MKNYIKRLWALTLTFSLFVFSTVSAEQGILNRQVHDEIFNTYLSENTAQMRYVNQFFNADGSWSEMGLDLCKWIDMSEREISSRSNSGYLMLEEAYVHHQDTLFHENFVSFANKSMETISSMGTNLAVDFANHQLMKQKFGDAGAYAIPYYEYFAEIYLSFLQNLEIEMSTMDIAFDTLVAFVGAGIKLSLEDGVPALVKEIKQSDLWNSLSADQKYALDTADKLMNREFPPLQKYQHVIDEIGIVFDFAGTAASWINVFTTKENLNIQQQLYMAAFSKVTDDHLDVLLNLRESLQNSNSLAPAEQANISGAIGALICDIYSTRNSHMEAAANANWNVKLGTYKSLCEAVYSTAEFGIALSGIDDILSAATGAKGFASVTAVASIGKFVLSLATQDYLDVRQQTEVIYNLKKAIVECLKRQLFEYANTPTHEQAIEIIASLNLLKQAKLSGEEMIAMFYLAKEADSFGLNDSPAALAILWNELINTTSVSSGNVDFNAALHIKRICAVYQDRLKITDYTYDANTHNGIIRYKVNSTPVAFYKFPTITSTEVRYQGVSLNELPITLANLIESKKWTPTDEFVRSAVLTPANALMAIHNEGYEYSYNPDWQNSQYSIDSIDKKSPLMQDAYVRENQFHRENAYIYKRGDIEVFTTADEWDKYCAAEKIVEQLLNNYSISINDFENHQAEERMIWAWVTHRYIEAFPMFDPSNAYLGVDRKEILAATQTVSPTTAPTLAPTISQSAATEADWSKPYKFVASKGNQDPKKGTRISEDLFGKVLSVKDSVGGWFNFIAPYDGSYSFSVLAPNLSRSSFSIEVYTLEAGKKHQHRNSLPFQRSAQIQTQTIHDVKAGETICWWDNDGTGRGYTLTEPFKLMITYQGSSAD